MRIAAVIVICALLASKGALAAPDSSSSPSFDCAHAATPVEHLTCANPELSRLDAKMADVFRTAREAQDQAGRLASLQDQRQWLQSRLETCAIPSKGEIDPAKAADATSCLTRLYTDRIATLTTNPKARVSAAAAQLPSFDKTIFAATGTHEAILTVPTFGRYAIEVKSDQGTAIQLVDKMAGPGNTEGSAGHADGRIDAFLDHGQYKVKLFADPHGSGDTELSITPSVEQEDSARQLVELKPVDADLGDHQQRSYWLNITTIRPVAIEASGRYLDTLSLWRDGKWLVDATPSASMADPSSGQPLAVRQISTTLAPGLYRLTAYGGVGQKWANGGDAKPLHIRFGIPTLAEAGRTHLVASATGIDRFLVPASATYFRLDIDKPDHAAISVQPYNSQRPFETGSNRATIDKKSRDPFAEVFTGQGAPSSFTMVTVERQPSAAYQLTWFDDRQERTPLAVNAGDIGWIATYNSGNAVDQLDPTIVVTDPKDHVIASTALKIGKTISWKRQFNLLGESSLFLEATEPVDLSVDGSGADAEYRIDPLIVHERYSRPPDEPSGYVWKLDPGFYRLNIRPKQNGKGVLSLAMHASGTAAPTGDAPHQAAAMLQMSFPAAGSYGIYGNIQADVHTGLRIYASPINIQLGISFEMSGGQTLTLPVAAATDGRITAISEDGIGLPLSVDKGGSSPTSILAHGKHDITLTLPPGEPRYVAISFVAHDLQGDTALPAIDAKLLAGLPDFPVLADGKPAYLNLATQRQASFAVPVTTPALYRLESTGIIETAGDLRTRIIPELDRETANGIGRNFLIQRYLNEGDYQLTVTPSGASAGPVGVTLSKTPLVTLGTLTPELTARATLPPSNAGLYTFHIDKAGSYSLKTLGLGHDFTMRLEDEDGWPLLPPGGTADVTYDFTPGDYRMILLPGAVENRAVTTLHRIEKPVERSGHGPFALTLDEAAQNRWLEPAKGEPRTPDAWTFTLPAPANVTVSIDSGMTASLTGKDAASARAAQPGKDWTGLLPAGDYQLAVTSVMPNSRVDYTLTVSTKELLAGNRRSVTAPADIPVSIGTGAPVEINSYGDADMRATLYDEAGKIVASNDDRDNDWNFSIAGAFPPGQYKLHVAPVGSDSADTEVVIEQPAETQDQPAMLDKPATIADALVHVVPIDMAALAADSLLIVDTQSDNPVGIALEAEQDGVWKTLGTQAGMNVFVGLPLGDKPAAMRLRLWSRDRNATPIKYTITDVQPKTVTEGSFSKAITLPFSEAPSGLAAVHVSLKQPGVLFAPAEFSDLQWSTMAGFATGHSINGQINASGKDIWLVSSNKAGEKTLQLHRADLNAGKPLELTVPTGEDGLMLPVNTAKPGTMVLWKSSVRGLGQAAVRPCDVQGIGVSAYGGTETARMSVTVPFADNDSICLWQPDAASQTPDLPITIQHFVFKNPEAQTFKGEIVDGVFAGKDAMQFTLPKGAKTLWLNLPEGTAALLTNGQGHNKLVWSWRPRLLEVQADNADGLILLYTSKTPAAYNVRLVPGAMRPVQRYDTEGTLITLNDADLVGNFVALGAVQGMTSIPATGQMIRGSSVSISEGYYIQASIDFGPGLMGYATVPAFVPDDATVFDPDPISAKEIPIEPLHISAGPVRLIRAHVSVPSILYSQTEHNKSQPQLIDANGDYFFLTPNSQSLGLMALPADPSVKSTMTLSVLTTTPIGEGIGPKRRIAPGEARAFSFSLSEARTVGAGVRASVDIANCYVVGPDGKQQGGKGKLVMASLPAGTSVMVVEVPTNGEPVEIEPALVGSVVPGNGPPDDVKAQYLAMVKDKKKQ